MKLLFTSRRRSPSLSSSLAVSSALGLAVLVAQAGCSSDPADSMATGGIGAGGGTASGGTAATGAAPGTGAAPADGGTGGTDGSGGDGASGAVGCEGADILCEDFEAVAEGALPDGWVGRESYCEGQNKLISVATDQPRGQSSQALKISNSSPGNCRIAKDIGTNDDFWVRAYVYWGSGVDFTDKEVLSMDLIPASGIGKDDPAVRFGSRTKAPCEANGGAQVTMIGIGGGEVTGCSGAHPLPQGSWYCFEAHVTQSGNLTVETFIDGADLTYSSSGKPEVDVVDLGQAPGEKVNHLRLGMFSTGSVMGDVWVDDVAVSTTRIGCGD